VQCLSTIHSQQQSDSFKWRSSAPIRTRQIRLGAPLIRQPVSQQIDPAIHRQASLAYAKTVAAAGEDVQLGRAIGAGPAGIEALDHP
jgi:hypothetical protein